MSTYDRVFGEPWALDPLSPAGRALSRAVTGAPPPKEDPVPEIDPDLADRKARFMEPVPYDEIDPEIRELVRALNEIPTLRTFESCCGHGKRPVVIWFHVENVRWFHLLGRALDRRYGGFGFRCQLDTGDEAWPGPDFLLESIHIENRRGRQTRGSDRGSAAYAAGAELAGRIRELLADERFVYQYIRSWE